jgi:DNA-binding MarR family transcriptional regulator
MSRHSDFGRFFDEIARLRGRLRLLFEDVRRAAGLNEMELTVLTATVNAVAPPTVAQIGRSLGHPRQVVQRAANRLVELGLVTLVANPDHKRAWLLVPTEAGRAVKAEDSRSSEATIAAILAQIDEQDFAEAADRLHAIRLGIESFLKGSRA